MRPSEAVVIENSSIIFVWFNFESFGREAKSNHPTETGKCVTRICFCLHFDRHASDALFSIRRRNRMVARELRVSIFLISCNSLTDMKHHFQHLLNIAAKVTFSFIRAAQKINVTPSKYFSHRSIQAKAILTTTWPNRWKTRSCSAIVWLWAYAIFSDIQKYPSATSSVQRLWIASVKCSALVNDISIYHATESLLYAFSHFSFQNDPWRCITRARSDCDIWTKSSHRRGAKINWWNAYVHWMSSTVISTRWNRKSSSSKLYQFRFRFSPFEWVDNNVDVQKTAQNRMHTLRFGERGR